MGHIFGFSHEVFPVAGNDDISSFSGVTQDSRIIRSNGKDIAQEHDFVPQCA